MSRAVRVPRHTNAPTMEPRWDSSIQLPSGSKAEDVMRFINAACVAALAVIATGTLAPRCEAAPLPTNVAAMKAGLDKAVVQVRYGGWHGGWGYRGSGGYRGWGHRGWGLGAVAAGALVGGAIANSGYYGAYPYYGGGYAYDYCPPYGYEGHYPGSYARHYGW
jgi:hypothetical protein